MFVVIYQNQIPCDEWICFSLWIVTIVQVHYSTWKCLLFMFSIHKNFFMPVKARS